MPATEAHKMAQSASRCSKEYLLLIVLFHRKVLEMIEIQKSLIESCCPLAKMVLEMLALKNFTKHSLLQIKLPPYLLLNTVHERTVDVVCKASQVHVRQSDNTHGSRATYCWRFFARLWKVVQFCTGEPESLCLLRKFSTNLKGLNHSNLEQELTTYVLREVAKEKMQGHLIGFWPGWKMTSKCCIEWILITVF